MESVQIGPANFNWGSRTYIMGILNVTPDSFSGDGILAQSSNDDSGKLIEQALEQARQFLADGADILDIGGESTRPGAPLVSQAEEIARVIPVIKAVAAEYPQAVLSVDTYKAEVARLAVQNGAHIVNDVWALRGDPAMAAVVAQAGAWVILMHNRSKPENAQVAKNLGGRYIGVEYEDLITDVIREMAESAQMALDAGISPNKIILDPGIGFGKTVEQNLALVNQLDSFKSLGYPLLLAPSRKSFIGYTLNLPPEERMEGTAAAIAIGIDRGADMVRVHDVKAMARVAKMTDALVRNQRMN